MAGNRLRLPSLRVKGSEGFRENLHLLCVSQTCWFWCKPWQLHLIAVGQRQQQNSKIKCSASQSYGNNFVFTSSSLNKGWAENDPERWHGWLLVLQSNSWEMGAGSRKLTRLAHHCVEVVVFSTAGFPHRCAAQLCFSPGSVKDQVCPHLAFVFSLCLILLACSFCDSSGPSSPLFELERDLLGDILM